MKSFRQSLFIAIALLTVGATAGSARAATATWTGAVNNNWNTSGNWSWSPACAGCLPGTGGGANADVTIGAGAGTVAINAALGSISLATMTISGGTINGSSTNIATTGISMSAGTFTVNSGTLMVTGDLTLSGNATFHTSSTSSSITGNVNQGSTGTLDLNAINTVNGNFTQTANGTVTTPTAGGSLTVGTVGTPKTLKISAGSLTGNAGNLTVNGDVTVDGSGVFTGPNGTAAFSVTGNATYSSSGDMNLRSGSSPVITVNGSFTKSGSGTLTGPGTGGSLTVGTVGSPKTVSVSAGQFNGAGGTITINGSLSLSSTGSFNGSSTTTSITGDVTHSSSGTLDCNGGATTVTGSWSQSGGTTTAGNDTLAVGTAMVPKSVTVSGGAFNGGSGTITITGDLGLMNDGGFRGSSATTTIGGNVSHDSTGALNLNNGNTSITGSFSESAGTTTNMAGSFSVGVVMVPKDVTLSGGSVLGGAGTMTLTRDVTTSGSASLRLSSATTNVTGNVTQGSSGTLNLNGGNLTVGGFVNQTGGTISGGTGTTAITGNLTEAGGTYTGSTGLISVGGNLSVSTGSFTGGSGINKISGDLTLSGGSCTLTTGTTWLAGTFNRDNGNTFDGAGGTVLFRAGTSKSHTFSGAAMGRVIFNDSLVGYWSLEESAGSRADSSGYANDGTLNGTYTAASTRPSVAFADTAAITFNGSSNYITLGTTNLPVADAAQTISAWVNFSSAAATQTIVAMTASGSAIKLGLGGGNLSVLRNDGTALVQASAASLTNAWHHVAYVFDPTLSGVNRDKLYIDGVASTGTNNSHNSAAPTGAFLGATSAGVDLYSGSLDEVRIYTRALGAREMTDLAFGRMPNGGGATHTLDALDTSSGTNVGHFVLASGIVAGSGALTIEGDWFNYGGQFTGTGGVTLNGAGASRVLLSGGYFFSNLTINSTGKYTMSDRLWVTGTLNLAGQASSFNDGGYTFHAGVFTTATTNAYQVTTAGSTVIDGRSNQTITAQNFNRLRLEAPNETGLAGYWKLDEGQETTARDVSGSGNNGTLSSAGATWTAASTTIGYDNAAAASFNGTSGYIQASATGLPAANSAQTVSAWVKFSSAAATQTLAAMTAGGSAINLGLSGGNLRVRRSDGTVLVQVAAPSANTWHHVGYVYDPTASGANRDQLFVDGTATTGTNTAHDGSSPTAIFLGATSAAADFLAGQLDDVRVYARALTSAQVTSLKLGRYAGTGVATTLTLGHNVSVASTGAGVFIDSGVLYSSTFTMTVSVTGTPCRVDAGTLHVGSSVINCDGGLTVNPMGTLLMDESAGQFQPGVNSTITIDGTFTASNTGAIIQRDNNGERYAFKVGSFSGATPVLNITGLAVRDTDASGMQINANTGAVTTFTRFDNITFRRGTGTYVSIYSTSLFLNSSGCVFGVGDGNAALPTFAVTLTGNGTGDGETRAVFGATCQNSKTTSTGSCQDAWASDDDADNNGTGDNLATNGAVVQYVRSVSTDIAGNVEGLPTAAFDWSTFTYYSTYATFHDASGTADRIYVRDQTGAMKNNDANYKWDTPSGETIVGTPRWNTTAGVHYLYVALASGKVYRLIDNGSSLIADTSGGWGSGNNPFDCGCTIVSPLALDTTNLYWGGTTAGPTQKVWTLGQATRSQPGPAITITPTITSASPAIWTNGATSYLFIGTVGNIIKLNVTTQVLDSTNTNPGSASVRGRVVTTASNKLYAGDDGGTMWSLDPANFAGTTKFWSRNVGQSIQSSPYVDSGTTSAGVYFGTEGGAVYGLNVSTGAILTGYPSNPDSATDPIRAAALYTGGMLVVGNTKGKLFFIDRSTGTLYRKFYFGPTESVSGVGYDSNASRYMVSTSDSSTNDGRLYYIDVIGDPTPGSP